MAYMDYMDLVCCSRKAVIPNHSLIHVICVLFEFEFAFPYSSAYHQTSNVRRTLVGNIIVDNSDVVGASPVGAAPTTSSLST